MSRRMPKRRLLPRALVGAGAVLALATGLAAVPKPAFAVRLDFGGEQIETNDPLMLELYIRLKVLVPLYQALYGVPAPQYAGAGGTTGASAGAETPAASGGTDAAQTAAALNSLPPQPAPALAQDDTLNGPVSVKSCP